MQKSSTCPYKIIGSTDTTFRPNFFYRSINKTFAFISLIFLFLVPLYVIYTTIEQFTTSTIIYLAIYWWSTAIILLLAYPLTIRQKFVVFNQSNTTKHKIPFYGILTNLYDVIFQSRVLLREIDVKRSKSSGDIYLTFFGFRPAIIVTSARLAEQISKDPLLFSKSDPRDLRMPYFFNWVGNNNIVLANGDKWKETRKLINPTLNNVQMFLPLMQNKINVFCDKIENEISNSANNLNFASIKLNRWLKALSLDISGEALFGYNFNHLNEDINPGIAATDYVLNEIFNPWRVAMPIINKMPIKSNMRLIDSMKLLDDLVLQMISYYSTIKTAENNVLSLLINGKEQGVLSVDDLRNNILALVLASHETTQVALSGILYYLARFPNIQQQLREESIALFPDLNELSRSQKDLDKKNSQYWKLKTFENLENFILESLRLYSPLANQNPRTTTDVTELGGYTVPNGTLIIMNLHAIHMNNQYWDNAEQFDMHRFNQSLSSKYAYLPFGNGSRICSGREFSLIEQKLAVCCLLRKFEISLPNEDYKIPIMRYSFTGLPDETFKLNFKKIK